MKTITLLTLDQAAGLLRINEHTLNALAYSGKIPHIQTPSGAGGAQLRFNMAAIDGWLKCGPALPMNDREYIERQRRRLEKRYPEQLAALHEFDRRFIGPRKPKGYNLTKVTNKKLGFVYYVRYIDKGKLVPTRWSTHTNDLEAATHFAILHRDKLLAEYRRKKALHKVPGSLFAIMKRYYEKNSPYLEADARRGRTLSETARRIYHNAVLNHWLPYLKKQRVTAAEEITTPFMALFQDHCLGKGIKPQTVNHYVSFISQIFDFMLIRGYISANPCAGLAALKVGADEYQARGCYHLSDLRGVFNKRWHNELSCLLCLVIYTTGMRNSEMDRIQVRDIIQIGAHRFINIPKSKTRYGARVVPLHEQVYRRLARYIGKHNRGPDDLLFCNKNGGALPRSYYTAANAALGKVVGYDQARLEKEHITFYSGRHFWKTLMNANELGEVEEYFMGHRVSQDVAKRYNHRDKQGQEKIVGKAGEVFQILDRQLFR
jgi:integrase